MEELRELILSHLEELHGSGLSSDRYQLYVDTVYQCESRDNLIELAALDLQLEANDFFLQLLEQIQEDEQEQRVQTAYAFQDNEGFGDEDDEGFGDEDVEGFGEEPEDVSEEIDANILKMQKALLGVEESMDDPDYFDIDALLTKVGGVSTEINIGVKYNDELENLLSVYPDESDDNLQEDDLDPANTQTVSMPAQQDGFGQPVSFGKPLTVQQNSSGFARPAQEVRPPQDISNVFKSSVKEAKSPAPASVAIANAKNVFTGFSKRKVVKD